MKYAREVIDLMAAFPGREFRMAEILRHVTGARNLPAREVEAARKGVRRVLVHLEDSGQVLRHTGAEKSALYSWAAAACQARERYVTARRALPLSV
ncbi:putative phage protein [Bordetella avium 197N]|uniref:Phage protein n=1 Tax=Bordetella avium (strain 197N) TaxID=360910 RepID=Q2L2E6_BORA1|nr:putative phage protein [Bordetella avium 197N]